MQPHVYRKILTIAPRKFRSSTSSVVLDMLPANVEGRVIVTLLCTQKIGEFPSYLVWPNHCSLELPFLLHRLYTLMQQPAMKQRQLKTCSLYYQAHSPLSLSLSLSLIYTIQM